MRPAWLAEFLAFSPGPAEEVRLFFAPGRVNLLGEHLDYNGGTVLPAAIQVGTWCAIRPRAERRWRVGSHTESAVVEAAWPAIRVPRAAHGFAQYPFGVVVMLEAAGIAVPGADCYFWGTVPQGAGLSSSASLEVVTAYALTAVAGQTPDRVTLARIAQQAENAYVGVPCGLMDQLTVALGQAGHALLIPLPTLAVRAVPVPHAQDWALVIVDSRKPHHLVASPYRQRRQECEAALARLQQAGWPIQALADIAPEALPQALAIVRDPVLQRRVRHVVSEQQRTLRAAEVLAAGDFVAFGQLMNASHRSLQADYDVTGPELDTLAEAAWAVPGCVGSRMTGAGFGGSTIAWVARDAVDAFQAQVRATYAARFGREPGFLVAELGDGVHEVAWTNEEEIPCASS
ncbi:MAG: galactokinase [Firmicutes bacterium]|nr:galactokinase [Bacillota bacterium]